MPPSSAVKEGWGNLERNERQPLSCHQLFPGPKAPAEEWSHGGERDGEREKGKRGREVHVQLPALSGWRVIEEEEAMGKKRARKREGHTHLPPHLPSSRVCLPPPSPTHPLTPDFLLLMSPPLPPSCPPSSALSPSPPPCHSLLLACLPHSLLPPPSPPPRLSSTAEVNTTRRQVNTPFFFSFFFSSSCPQTAG